MRPSPHTKGLVKIDPKSAMVRNNLGNALARRGRLDEAIAQFRTALEIKPDFEAAREKPRKSFEDAREGSPRQ